MSQKQLNKKWIEDEDTSDDAEVLKLEIGESIEGVLLEKKPSDTFGFVYKIKTKERELPQIVCGTTILNRKMEGKEAGVEVLIERVKDVKTSKGRWLHDFKVYHMDDGSDGTQTATPCGG